MHSVRNTGKMLVKHGGRHSAVMKFCGIWDPTLFNLKRRIHREMILSKQTRILGDLQAIFKRFSNFFHTIPPPPIFH